MPLRIEQNCCDRMCSSINLVKSQIAPLPRNKDLKGLMQMTLYGKKLELFTQSNTFELQWTRD